MNPVSDFKLIVYFNFHIVQYSEMKFLRIILYYIIFNFHIVQYSKMKFLRIILYYI